jgi:hypothetical protein
MPVFDFDPSPHSYVPLDYRLVQNGCLVQFSEQKVLSACCDWLSLRGYFVHRVEASDAADAGELRALLVDTIKGWPSYAHGRSWASFEDGCRDITFPAHGGVVIVLNRLDDFASRDFGGARQLLATLARTAWFHLLKGDRFFSLLQAGDPDFSFGPVSEVHPHLNFAEWGSKRDGLAEEIIAGHFRVGERSGTNSDP